MGINFTVANSASVRLGSSATLNDQFPFTISAWINPAVAVPSSIGSSDIFAKRGGTGVGRWGFQISSDNRLRFFRYDITTFLTVISAASALTLNTWQHVLVTNDGSGTATNTKFYVNAVETAYSTQQNAIGVFNSDSALDTRISDDEVGGNPISAFISEVAFWGSAVLNLQQIQLLSNAKVKGIPLQIIPPTGGLRVYAPMDDFPNNATVSGTSVVRDRSSNGNDGTILTAAGGGNPTALAEQVLSYQP